MGLHVPRKTFLDVSEGRRNNFDFLRLLLAIVVLFSHGFPLLYGKTSLDPLGLLTQGRMNAGQLAVHFFFVISGFLITMSWVHSRGWLDYLKKRILRIYPGYIVASLVCIALIAPLGADSLATYVREMDLLRFFRDLMRFYGWNFVFSFRHNPIHDVLNGSVWTIRYEFACYLMVAALGLLGIYRRCRWIVPTLLAGTLVVFGLQSYPLGRPHALVAGFLEQHYFWEHTPRLVSYFLAGMVFYLYRERIPYSRTMCLVAWGALAVSCVLDAWIVVLPLCGSYLLLYFVFNSAVRLQHFGRRGDFSYGTYLYAYPVQQLVVRFFGSRLGYLPSCLLALALTFCLAVISWYLVEKPCLKLKRREQPRPDRAPAPTELAAVVKEAIQPEGSGPAGTPS